MPGEGVELQECGNSASLPNLSCKEENEGMSERRTSGHAINISSGRLHFALPLIAVPQSKELTFSLLNLECYHTGGIYLNLTVTF